MKKRIAGLITHAKDLTQYPATAEIIGGAGDGEPYVMILCDQVSLTIIKKSVMDKICSRWQASNTACSRLVRMRQN